MTQLEISQVQRSWYLVAFISEASFHPSSLKTLSSDNGGFSPSLMNCIDGAGEDSVFWFRARSDGSHPSFIHAHGNSSDECERRVEKGSPQRCVYSFSKHNVSSSDAGTYYCAVATCGEIWFGNGRQLDIEDADSHKTSSILFLLSAALILSLIVVVFLIYALKYGDACFSRQPRTATTNSDQQGQQRGEDSLVYAAPRFARRKPDQGLRRDAAAAGEESVYSDVKVYL
ncbi:uncharacterized protein LOC142999620 [Genypterus blacodes]|uniref:uncharacterized protein LOC142999620 n=1 Tax=Genypterus blacodes TaxID=154954 RepID=UPI003F76E233